MDTGTEGLKKGFPSMGEFLQGVPPGGLQNPSLVDKSKLGINYSLLQSQMSSGISILKSKQGSQPGPQLGPESKPKKKRKKARKKLTVTRKGHIRKAHVKDVKPGRGVKKKRIKATRVKSSRYKIADKGKKGRGK